jgi:hypothetical protein
MADIDGRLHLLTEMNEFVKKYIAYDASNRMEYVYVAKWNAINGEPCSVTRYVYDGVSTRVVKAKEYQGAWVTATMDI